MKNPFLLLFSTRWRQITASVISLIIILTMLPIGALSSLAASSQTLAASSETTVSIVDPATLKNPVLGTGMNIFPPNDPNNPSPKDKTNMYVYYGQYPQDTTDQYNMQPIKWQAWVKDKGIHSNNGETQVYSFFCDGAVGLASAYVLDGVKWYKSYGKWDVTDKRWIVSYDDSALNEFLSGTFLYRAFSEEEKAAMSTRNIVTYGGRYEIAVKPETVPTESNAYKVYAPCIQHDGPGYITGNVLATPYALSKNIETYASINGGPTYGSYWYRTLTVAAGNPASYYYYDGVVRVATPGPLFKREARTKTYGVRPFTRILGDEILLVSAVGAKNDSKVVNAEMPTADEYEYKLTVRDSKREFVATQSGISYNSDSLALYVGYTGARVGADEAISYIITDKDDNVYQYHRVKTSTSAAGSITVNVPYSSFLGDHIKVKVFNEQIRGEKYTDYGSPFSTFEISKPHEHSWESKWTYNETHHWHECTALDCEATDAEKDGYGPHSFTEEIAKPEALKTPANATDAAVYYKSCICGAISTTETFSYGEPSDHIHSDGVYFNKLDSTFSGGTLEPGNYYLGSDITLTERIQITEGTVNLCLNGHTIKQTGNGPAIDNSKNLNLYDCSGDNTGRIIGNPRNNVDMFSCAIYNKGTFTMYGGTITGSEAARGGGVFTAKTFIMNGGIITGNHSRVEGGAVYVEKIDSFQYTKGNFIMNGGTISGNSSSGNGGGVYVSGDGSFTMNGGTISDNVSGPYGGGVYVSNVSKFTMNGGTISDNVCSFAGTGSGGGGVYAFFNEIIKVGGTATITNNFQRKDGEDSLDNLYMGTKLNILDGFSGSIGISISKKAVPTHETPYVFTNNYNADYSKFFFSDNPKYEVKNSGSDSNQVLQLEPMHEHQWNEGTPSPEPTYLTDGQRIDTCIICNKTKTVVLPKLVDSVEPTGDITIGESSIKKILNAITFGLFFKDTQKVTITSADAESGVKSTQYYLSNEILDENAIKNISSWMDYTGQISLNPNGKYVVYVKITDNQDNVTYMGSNGIIVDNVKPVLELNFNGYKENTWKTDGPITINMVNTAYNPGITTYQYKKDGDEWANCDALFVIEEDCKETVYTFRAISESGMVSDEKSVVVKKDTVAPDNINISYGTNYFKKFLNTITFGLFFKNTVKITFSATDVTSGVKEFKFNLGENEYKVTANNGSANFSFSPQFKGQIFNVKVIDNAGNESDATATEFFVLDAVNPKELTVDAGGYTSDSWTKEDVVFTVSGSTSLSGIAKYQYSDDNGLNWYDIETVEETAATATEPYNAIKAMLTVSNSDRFGTRYQFRAMSNVGLLSKDSNPIVVKIDKTPPVFNVLANTIITHWTKGDVTLTVTASDEHSGLAAAAYSFDDGKSWQTENKKMFSSNQVVKIKVRDAAGNISDVRTIEINKIDKTAPTVSISGNPTDWTKDDVTLTVTAQDLQSGLAASAYSFDGGINWQTDNTKVFGSNQVVNIKVRDAIGNISEVSTVQINRIDKTQPVIVSVSGNPTDWTKDDVTLTITVDDQQSGLAVDAYSFDDGKSWQSDNTKVFSFNQVVKIKVRDAAGNISDANTIEINRIDKTAPTGDITIDTSSVKNVLNTITFGLFFKNTQSVAVTSDDSESGVDNTYYYLSDKKLSETEVNNITAWTKFNGSFSIDPNNRYVVYVKIIDKVGNSSIINTDGIVLDNIAPVVIGVTEGKTYCSAVSVNVVDDNLDTVKLNGKAITLTGGKFTVPPADKAQTITVTDKSGNSTTVKITVYDGHTWDEGVVTEEPTTSNKGIKTYTCTYCRETKTEEIEMLPPTMIDGQNADWNPEEGGTLSFRSNASIADFIAVLINGKVIDPIHYDVREGSIIVTLKPDYLATLPKGKYTIGIQSTTGIASAEFTIAAKADEKDPSKPGDINLPQTDNNRNMLLWLVLLLIPGGTLTVLGVKSKKRKAVK